MYQHLRAELLPPRVKRKLKTLAAVLSVIRLSQAFPSCAARQSFIDDLMNDIRHDGCTCRYNEAGRRYSRRFIEGIVDATRHGAHAVPRRRSCENSSLSAHTCGPHNFSARAHAMPGT